MSVVVRNSLYISNFSREGVCGQGPIFGPASAVWVTAGLIRFFPLRIEAPGTVYKMFWMNGATVGTDTMQMGLYLSDGTEGAPGTRIINGTATTTSGINACQYDNITDYPIGPGWYWLAQLSSGTTTTVFRGTYGSTGRGASIYQQTIAALPATATPIAVASAVFTVAGLVMRSAP